MSDANNALKTGYDPVALAWPAWIERVGVDAAFLPDVVAPGVSVGSITPAAARAFGLPADVCIARRNDGRLRLVSRDRRKNRRRRRDRARHVADPEASVGQADLRASLRRLQPSAARHVARGRCVQLRRRGASGPFLAGRDRSSHAPHRPGCRNRARLLSPDGQGRAVSGRRSGILAAHGAAPGSAAKSFSRRSSKGSPASRRSATEGSRNSARPPSSRCARSEAGPGIPPGLASARESLASRSSSRSRAKLLMALPCWRCTPGAGERTSGRLALHRIGEL